MKTKHLIITLAAAIVVGGFTIYKVQAATPDALAGRGRFGGHLLQRAAEKLNLTEDQKTQIKAALRAEKDTLAKLLTRLHEARRDMRETIRSANASEANVRAASAKVAAVEADLAVERLKLYGKISPILTNEQREKIAEFESRVDEFVTDVIGRIGERLAE